jgi:glycyl-radical enzyme activating protein
MNVKESSNSQKGMVADIQRCSTHDGPGIRTTVFLKGCNLHCAWCHNPETINSLEEWLYYPDKCIECGLCHEGCYSGAKVLCGKKMTVDEVMQTVLLDQPYYANEGGLTISGGEPLMQPIFTQALLVAAKSRGIHVAIETNLTLPWKIVEPVVQECDLVMMDMKLWQDDLHIKWTGESNKFVRDNLLEISRINKPIIVRTPIIPTVNDQEEEIKLIAKFVSNLNNVLCYELLPYHSLGQSKQLGDTAFKTMDFEKPKLSDVLRLASIAKEYGIKVRVAGNEIS